MDRSELEALRTELTTQDGAATAEPLYCVMQEARVYGVGGEYTDLFEWIADDGEYIADKEDSAMLDKLAAEGRPLSIGGLTFNRVGYKIFPDFVTAFLTRKAAEEYLVANAHNLVRARIYRPYLYVESLHRNEQMRAVRAHFMGRP